MPIVSVTRLRLGLNSPTSAVAFGMMQPRPRPEMSRSQSSCSTLCAKPVASVRSENQSVAPMITGRRPILSASMLKRSDPMSTPTLAAAKTGPSAEALGAEVAEHGRGDVAHRLHVEAVHDQADHAEREDADLQRPDGAVFEEFREVDRGRGRRGSLMARAV